MLKTRPDLRHEIGPEHYGAFYRAAERNDVAALEAMLACGFDPNRPDESIGKTALHAAAMEGSPDAVRVLLANGASVAARDREFKAQPLIWAAEGSRTGRNDRDHAAVGRVLLDAGSPADWEQGEEPSEQIVEIVNEWRGILAE
jgi:ankyrin repeat protein